MANISRLRVSWTGSQVVGPSVSTFYFTQGNEDPSAVEAFFVAIKALIPNGVLVTIPRSGDVINDATGALVSTWSTGASGNTTGTGTGNFILGTGARLVWETAGIRNGRHVRGSTYLVPLISSVFDASGRITPTAAGTIGLAASNMRTALGPDQVIWSRPRGGVVGASHAVNGHSLSEQPSWLRSRRV